MGFTRDMQILQQLRTDSITGFFTRTYMEVELISLIEKKMEKYQSFCMFMDFNFLKYANEMYGYDKVDVALKRISSFISKTVDELVPDNCIIRYGGDEICIFGFNVQNIIPELLKKRIQTGITAMPLTDCLGLSLGIGFSFSKAGERKITDQMQSAKHVMRSDKDFVKEGVSFDLKKSVELLMPTIARMVPKKDYEKFIAILSETLKK